MGLQLTCQLSSGLHVSAFNATRIVFFPQSKPHPLRLFTFSGGAATFATAAPSSPHSEAAFRRFHLQPRLPTLFVFPSSPIRRRQKWPRDAAVAAILGFGSSPRADTYDGLHVHPLDGARQAHQRLQYSKHKGLGHDKFVRSCTFSVGGHDWCIRFYPDGSFCR
nr:unnamed protein product [Digitaria exilis]